MSGRSDRRFGWRRLLRDEGGNFALLFAIALPAIIGTAALMVDEAALYHQRRTLQTAVDLAAIHAAGNPANATNRVREALADSRQIAAGLTLAELESRFQTRLTVEAGSYRAASAIAAPDRFVPAANPADSVRVSLVRPGELFFFRGLLPPPALSVRATANASTRAAFSIGSRLLSLEGGLANALLDSLLGVNLSAQAVGYQALLASQVELFGVLDALAGRLDLAAGTYDQLLTTDIALSDLVAATATLLSGDAAVAANFIATNMRSGLRISGNRLVDLGPLGAMTVGTAGTGLAGSVGVLDLVGAGASIANGRSQAQAQLSLSVPGLSAASLSMFIGEPAQSSGYLGIGQNDVLVRTAQVRLRMVLSIGGTGLLSGTTVRLPIYVEVAPAQARLASLSCAAGQGGGLATIAARPGLLKLAIGEVADASFTAAGAPAPSAATIASVLGAVRITGSSSVALAEPSEVPLAFTSADIPAGTIRTASTTRPAQSLATSLINGLDLDVTLFGLSALNGLLRPAYEAAARATLLPLAPLVDGLLAAALDVAGVGLGEADIRLHGLDCRHATLVQ